MDTLKFIHTADLHLDSPFKGLSYLPTKIFEKLKESTFVSFHKIINVAILEHVDFILIAGDLFDDEYRSLKAQIAMRTEFERLEKEGIYVYIIHGNHDHLAGKWAQLNWPGNVYFFSSKVEVIRYVKNDTCLAHIYGFSYEQRAIIRNMTNDYKKEDGALFHIGMLHGNLEGKEGHDHYAPFSIDQLIQKEFDYWALGHIHKQQVLCEKPAIIYPGNIQGRHKKETGEKGCYLIELSKNGTNQQFIPTDLVIWENILISIDGISMLDELLEKIKNVKESYRLDKRSMILTIELIGTSNLHNQLMEKSFIYEFVDTINASEANEDVFIWISDCKVNTNFAYDRDTLKNDSHFISDLLNRIDEYSTHDLELALSSLISNRKAAPFLNELNEDFQEIINNAEKLILRDLLKE
ncbi:metallophosphoesterase family protein [Calidifontibacillus oryziterrae]|uniref:metallophosphoesterase family protein n=1 Tax=Calidifontibacillus oryziterrae TaxID=1191699 RepID=UPI000475A396|nr:DNA repair exonuclease [Calidifontibacillus oryziterrae]